jgi:hypothetical protein
MHGGMKLRPWEIDRLSWAEVAAALDEDLDQKKPPPGSAPLNDPATMAAYAARERSLTPRARLERERAKYQ